MNPALVCVSFGTSVPAARVNIEAVEAVCRETAPGTDFCRAFTSPTIRRILQRRGEEIDSLPEVLRRLEKAGYSDVIVQPTHFLYGTEYDRMRTDTDAYRPRFEQLRLGRPLLASQDDLNAVAARMDEKYPRRPDTALVLFGHGTLHFANATYPALQTVFQMRGRSDIFVGTAEGWPTLADIRNEVKNFREIHLVPLMLVNGDHVQHDLAGDGPDSWKSVLERDGHTVACSADGLGTDAAVLNLYRRHLEELLHAG